MKAGDKVELIVGYPTDIGIQVLVNGKDEGMLYHNEVYEPLEEGQRITGYVKKIRDDGKIDVSLYPQGFRNVIDINTNIILDKLKTNNGALKLNDKSTPEEIHHELKMSKKAFKNAVGTLYKLKRIRIEDDGIYLIK
ncbi:MAG: uncharacterized protein JWN78_3255 [Bacteroidota bacterium]|nr:uncharacterized protein [Bacteroidota bacterium]